MPGKTRVCKYPRCKHGKVVNLETDEYVCDGRDFYHQDCNKEKRDMMLIRDMWTKHISDTVVFSQLNKTLNELLDLPSVTSSYLVFVMEYIIANKCNLRYPNGFRYYVDKQAIKDAYKKKTQPVIDQKQFVANEDQGDFPKFAVFKKHFGFASILGDEE